MGRHIHISSGSVYDLTPDTTLTLPISEDFPIGPITEDQHPYMISKRMAEKELMDAHQRGYPMTIVRPTYVYGPDNYIYREAYLFDRISQDQPVLLPSKETGFYDLIHVDDLTDLCLLLGNSEDEKVLGKAFNGTSGKAINGYSMVKIISEFLDKQPEILYYNNRLLRKVSWPVDRPLFPYMNQGVILFDIGRGRTELGFQPKYSYEEGFKQTFDWWKDQQHNEIDWTTENKLAELIRLKKKKKEITIEMSKLRTEIKSFFEDNKSTE